MVGEVSNRFTKALKPIEGLFQLQIETAPFLAFRLTFVGEACIIKNVV